MNIDINFIPGVSEQVFNIQGVMLVQAFQGNFK